MVSILASASFRRSERHRAFLSFICERLFEGRAEEINESEIGVHVFGRAPGFNRSEDAIVRVEARQLRKRLESYFSSEGRHEPVILRIPSGSYVPVFEPRPFDAEVSRDRPSLSATPVEKLNHKWLVIGGVAVVASVVFALMSGGGSPKSTNFQTTALWAELFQPAQNTQIVLGDACFHQVQTELGRTLRVEEYLHAFRTPDRRPIQGELKQSVPQCAETTSFGDATLAVSLSGLRAPGSYPLSVKFARDVQMRDLKQDNFILLGGPRSNPWVQVFEPRLNFVRGFEEGLQPHIRNKVPRVGEPPAFIDKDAGYSSGEVHAAMAFVPNLERRGGVLLLVGTSMSSMEAAGEFLSRPTALVELRSVLNRHEGPLPYFELVLRASQVAGVTRPAAVVTARILGERASKRRD
ncbi:MAG: hypothetical protein ACK5UT_08190 [Acidobacteriota bacterium]|jgi:hypothetical protein